MVHSAEESARDWVGSRGEGRESVRVERVEEVRMRVVGAREVGRERGEAGREEMVQISETR